MEHSDKKLSGNHGFFRVSAAIPEVRPADCPFNAAQIIAMIEEAGRAQVQIVCFPELCITAYTCGDLFHQTALTDAAEAALAQIVSRTAALPIVGIVGLPVRIGNALYNVAAVFQRGQILGIVPKTCLPNYSEFYEQRWFSPADNLSVNTLTVCGAEVPLGVNLLFRSGELCFAVEICEDLWVPNSPGSYHALAGANMIFNLSATSEVIAKNDYLRQLIQQQSAKCITGYVYVSSGFGESTTDLVFAGNGYIVENGNILSSSKRFSFERQLIVNEIDVERIMNERQKTNSFAHNARNAVKSLSYRTVTFELPEWRAIKISRTVSCNPFVPASSGLLDERCDEIFNIQVSGLATRLQHTGIKSVVLGLSGGLDSTLALLVCVKTFDKLNIPRSRITGITMPGFGTTGQTHANAVGMMNLLGVNMREILIKDACIRHFNDIDHPENLLDVTFENAQARERTQILMDVANMTDGLVVGTGDLSELALGWATYNGDHISMYAVNAGVPKTLVRYLVHWVAKNENEAIGRVLFDILETPVSPELLPAENGKISQKTEDIVGPYELHDFFLYYTVRFGFRPAKVIFLAAQAFEEKYDRDTIKKWLRIFYKRFFRQQFKRSCMTDGPKVGSVNLSPRGDWRMPSDASCEIWLRETDLS
jgi:NAD+ synthase (glutamine-hydrolysing)